jgi:hypothetical protein
MVYMPVANRDSRPFWQPLNCDLSTPDFLTIFHFHLPSSGV